ncbi:hypothetical protein HDU93_006891, partial [Gonapodya sp. JEL0774]
MLRSTVVLGDTTKKFDVTAFQPGIDVVFTSVGDVSSFPFDVYEGGFPIGAFTGPVNSTYVKTIPVGINFESTLGTYSATTEIDDLRDVTGLPNQIVYSYNVTVRRSISTKFFALTITIIIWGLLIGYGMLTTDIRFKGQKMQVPYLALGASLLFALPNIRNAAPLAPPIGTQLDMAGLFVAILAI